MTEAALAGCCVLVTRPTLLAAETVDLLVDEGCEVLSLPVIDIRPRLPADIESQLARIDEPDIVIFVSQNAVECGLPLLDGEPRIAAIGPATRAALEARGASVDIAPDNGFDTESLLRHHELRQVAGKQVLIVRGQSGRQLLGDTLAQRGANVAYLAVYDRVAATPAATAVESIRARLDGATVDFTVVMSVESLNSLASILADPEFRLLRQTTLVTASERVIQTARDRLPSIQCALASDPRAPGMVSAMKRYLTTTSES